jgi:hypothetical protein
MKKALTNDKMVKNLVKELAETPHSIGLALLRERLMMMVDMTRESIEQNPTAWANGIFHVGMYEDLCNRIEKHCGFND